VKRKKPGGPSAEGANFERRRREDRGAEGVGCREGVSPSPLGEGSGVCWGELKKTTFGAFGVLFLQLNRNWLGH